MAQLKYFAAPPMKKPAETPKAGIYTEFLRTGRINRSREEWHQDEKRYISYEEVAARTGRKLEAAGTLTHKRINDFHASIQFPKLIFHRTIAGRPHLGYCHITTARTTFAEFEKVRWSFYIANFFSDIGDTENFFDNIQLGYSRMYFAVATELDKESGKLNINKAIRGDGLLFRTADPKAALKNVLMLGARHEALRTIVRNL